MAKILGPKLFGCREILLLNIKVLGFYRDAFMLRPINKTTHDERKQLCERSVPDLAKRISDYNPRIVISLTHAECVIEITPRNCGSAVRGESNPVLKI